MTGLLAVVAIGQTCVAQQTYAAPVQYAQQQYAQVEKTVFVAVEDPTTYYAGLVGTQQRQADRQQQAQQSQQTVDAKIDALTRAIQDLQRRLDEPAQQLLPDRPQKAAVSTVSTLSNEAAPLPPTVAQASLRGHQSAGLATLTRNCAGCHQGTAKNGGGVILFAADGKFTATDRDDLARIESAISSGRMPKRAKQPMTLREYVAIRDFLNEQGGNLALNSNSREKTR